MISESQMRDYYEQIAPRLTNYLVSNGESYESAKDLVQESFIKVWNKRDQYSADDNLVGIIYTTAKNLRIDRFRKDKYLVAQDEFDVVADETTETNPIEQEEYIDYIRACLQKALQELPNDLRECYTLFNIAKLSVKEIATQLSISESLVKVRVHRAKEKLAESLEYLKDSMNTK